MKTVRRTSKYRMVTAQPGSPANGLSNIIRLSDNETALWFDAETANELLAMDENEFNDNCDNHF